MNEIDLKEIVNKIQSAKAEFQTIEVKRAKNDVPSRLYDTLNALVHRDYSIHTEGMPIQLTIFADRLEVKNPGGLYGRLTLDTLGKVQPDTRNPVLATALEVNERGEFMVCIYQQAEEMVFGETESLIAFCKTPRTRKEIAEFLGLSSVTYALKKYVHPLIDEGIIKLANPDASSSPKQKYYTE